MNMELNKIYQGHTLETLKTFPDESIDCVVTSPPYWSLRDYGTDGVLWDNDINCEHDWNEIIKKPIGGKGSKNANVGANKNDSANMRDHDIKSNFCSKCGAWKGSLGLEPTFNLYIKHLCDIFDEVKRVLKPTGTCFVNIADTYASAGGAGRHKGYVDPKYPDGRNGSFDEPSTNKQDGALEKSLCQIPSRFAIEMCNRNWILRNELIWHKPNAMPSSVKDRFTVDFEKVFFFTKNQNYYFKQQLDKSIWYDRDNLDLVGKSTKTEQFSINNKDRKREERYTKGGMKNKRCVWSINTKPLKEKHFASYPVLLIEPMIKAGCPENGIVLDIFMGAGTTGLVAIEQNKKYVGVELNSEYIKIAEKRINDSKNKLSEELFK